MRTARQQGQGLVEVALVLPAIAVGMLLVVGLGLLARTNGGVAGVAGEAARAGALASNAATAEQAGQDRAAAVADGYGLERERLRVSLDTADFRRGGEVRATVDYTVPLGGLVPLVWGDVPLHHEAAEPVDPYRTFR